MQIFRYGMINSQILRAYKQLKDDGDIEEEDGQHSNSMFEMEDKLKSD